MKELYDEMRESSEKKTWSRGLELSRQNSIYLVGYSGQIRSFVVREQAKAVDYAVGLNAVDLDWSCTCLEAESPCSHAVAALLAWRQESEGRSIPNLHDAKWSLSYKIESTRGTLYLKRFLVRKEESKPLEASLASIKSLDLNGAEVSVMNADFELERLLALETSESHRLCVAQFPVLKELEIKFNEQGVQFDRSPRGFRLVIRKEGGGIFVKLDNEEGVFFDDFFFLNLTFFPLVKIPFSTTDEQILRTGKYLGAKEAIEFLGQKLPRLKLVMPVLNEVSEPERMPATIAIQSWEEDSCLCYRFLLAYGDPVSAWLEGDELKILDKKIPIRSREVELKALVEFERSTGRSLNRTYRAEIPKAFDEAKRLFAGRYPLIGSAVEDFANIKDVIPELICQADRFALSIHGNVYSLSQIKASRDSGGAVRLAEGSWCQISRSWFEGEGRKILDILLMNGEKVTKGGVLSLSKSLSMKDKTSDYYQLTLDWDKDFSLFPSPIELRPYQVEGAKWLSKLQNLKLGGILADEMGLGKTYQTLLSMQTPSLVVAPTSLLGNWVREAKLARPELKIGVMHGASRNWDIPLDIYITSYGTVRSDIDQIKKINFKTSVLDEAQNIKNPHARMSAACFEISADSRIALSGTPFENSAVDLWSLMNYCMPGLLGNFDYFKGHFSKFGDAARLKENISPFILRRLKSDVGKDLPEKSVQIVRCTMESDQKDFYLSLLDKIRSELAGSEATMSILTGLLRLRQAACDPFLVDSTTSASSTKLEYLVASLQEIHQNGQAALIFSQWTGLLDRLETKLRALGFPWSRLDGTTADREGAVDEFMTGKTNLFLISLKAGGTGLNLTRADHVFILDPWWNPAVEEQAIARTHRMGRSDKVFVHRLVCEDTVEEKIVDLQMDKTEQARFFLEDADLSSQLKLADLKKLLFSLK